MSKAIHAIDTAIAALDYLNTNHAKGKSLRAREAIERLQDARTELAAPVPEGICLNPDHRDDFRRTGRACSCPKYVRHPHCTQAEDRNGVDAALWAHQKQTEQEGE